jgi:hypothetical protein
MLKKESIETKLEDYAQTSQQGEKASLLPSLLKTTGVLAGVALVPCLSAGTAQGEMVIGIKFTSSYSGSITHVSVSHSFAAFDGKASWSFKSGGTMVNEFSRAKLLRNATQAIYAAVVPLGVTISAGEGNFGNYLFMYGDAQGHLGVQFQDEGETHYGWIQVDIDANGLGFDVIKWGYSEFPDMGFFVGGVELPEPTSLALLACGAAGLVARRRRKRSN